MFVLEVDAMRTAEWKVPVDERIDGDVGCETGFDWQFVD